MGWGDVRSLRGGREKERGLDGRETVVRNRGKSAHSSMKTKKSTVPRERAGELRREEIGNPKNKIKKSEQNDELEKRGFHCFVLGGGPGDHSITMFHVESSPYRTACWRGGGFQSE